MEAINMIGAVIYNGSNTMVIDLPTESLNLESRISLVSQLVPCPIDVAFAR